MRKIEIVRAPSIIRGGRTLEREVSAPMQLEGWCEVELIDAKTGLIKFHSRFRNLIVDAGLNALLSGTAMTTIRNYMAVGTSGVAPDPAQTGLIAEYNTPAARVTANGGIADVTGHNTDAINPYTYSRVTRLFTEAQVVGNLAEFGMFSAAAGGTMLFRQLFKDSLGNPVVISKTASDQLRITHELRVYKVGPDTASTVDVSGTIHDTVRRIADETGAWGPSALEITTVRSAVYETNVLGSRGLYPSGNQASHNSATLAAYAAGSFYRDASYVYDPGTANWAGGIGAAVIGVSFGASRLYQFSFTPKIMKDNTRRFTLNARWSITRYP